MCAWVLIATLPSTWFWQYDALAANNVCSLNEAEIHSR